VTFAFALVALFLSLTLSAITYGLARRYLTNERDSAAVRQSYVNALAFREAVKTPKPDPRRALVSLDLPSGSRAVVWFRDHWYGSSLVVGPDSLPVDLRRTAIAEARPARERFRANGETQLAVGVPIPASNAVYFELFSLGELDRTLRTLAFVLSATAAITTAAAIGIGRWAAGRVLHPMREISRAAADIAGGRLDTRLDVGVDSDLAGLADSFNSMVDALAARIERDARFASDVSHELRSPLTTLTTALSVLESRRDELPDRSRQALDLLSADLRRFQRLVEDLLEISRFDAGAVELSLEDVRVGELVIHAVEGHTRSDVPVRIEGGAADAVVKGDKRRLERVVANLVENADNHGGGVVGVSVSSTDGVVDIAVDDAGPGVAEQDRERVFERFARGPAAGRRSAQAANGVGLGLSLVREHVRLHGGRVWVEERPGGGARFVVELPAEQAS
jgi:signal transduction histidine kinase